MRLRSTNCRILAAGFAATIVVGCSQASPTAPASADTVVAALDCNQVDLALVAQDESTRRDLNFFDSGQNVILTAVPLGAGGPLRPECRYTRTASWRLSTSDRSLTCREYGETAGLQKLVECKSFTFEADLTVYVQHDAFGRARTFKVVR